jgi:hypothetical protein
MSPLSITPSNRDPAEEDQYRFDQNGAPCEWGESYHPDGYCPVHIGDIFTERYRVVLNLGYGSYSTVWLATDAQYVIFYSDDVISAQLTKLFTSIEALHVLLR